MNNIDITDKFICNIMSLSENRLIPYITKLLCDKSKRYIKRAENYDEELALNYVVYEPVGKKNNVCMLAHADTVGFINKDTAIYKSIMPDSYNTYYQTAGGLFDDRAGILGILLLVFKYDLSPYIIITGKEEIGCLGAIKLVQDYSELDLLFNDNNIQYLIEIDRHGYKEVVFYDLDYPEFEKIFTRYFDEYVGIWSDISVIAPYWDIAAANVSAGYYDEHTRFEYFNIDDLYATLNYLEKIILESNDYIREDRWRYKGDCGTVSFLLGDYNNSLYFGQDNIIS